MKETHDRFVYAKMLLSHKYYQPTSLHLCWVSSHNVWPLLSEGDRVIRGEWQGQQPEIVCDASFVLDCLKRAVLEGEKGMAGLLAHTCCTIFVRLYPETLRLAEVLMRLLPQFKATILGVKGKAGDQ